MSNAAIKWALGQPIKPATAKFVLMVMADCANDGDEAWPSLEYLIQATGLNRKTIIEATQRLREGNLVLDTGERQGRTKQVIVYRLNRAEIGTVERAPNWNGSESGTVPVLPGNSTDFGGEQSRFSLETVPKAVPGTLKEPKEEPSGNPHSSENQLLQGFEAAWAEYPKRSGGNSKAAALKAWNARRREGIPSTELHEGVKRYAVYLQSQGKIGTQYVKLASTFFGPDGHFRERYDVTPRQANGIHVDPNQNYEAGFSRAA